MDEFYSIVIPAYNEGDVIGEVLEGLGNPSGCHEVIVVDDGSTDDTAAIAKSKGARVIKHAENRGYGASLKTGILEVRSDYVVFFDGDGQHRKEDLTKIVRETKYFDMVVGARSKSSQKPLMRRPGTLFLRWFVNFLSGRKIPDINSGLRSLKVPVIKKYLHLMPSGFSFSTTCTVALIRMKYTLKYVPIEANPRERGKSTVKIFGDGFRSIMLIVNLTVLFNPLRVFLPASLVFIATSFVYFVLYSIYARVHVTASMVMLFITGVLLFFMGTICEQISAIRRELNRTDGN